MSENTRPRNTADLSVGEEIELDITGVAHGGIFIARHGGRVVFVTDAIPGERVRVRVTEARKKSFVRASVIEVLSGSPHRRDHVWGSASIALDPAHRAGGAEFGHIALDEQRHLLGTVVSDSLKRFAGIERSAVIEAAPGDDEHNGLGWRTRMRVHSDGRGSVGPYVSRTHTVVSVPDYPLARPGAERVALELGSSIGDARSFDVAAPSLSAPYSIGVEGTKRSSRGSGARIRESVGSREFEVSRSGFWQVHREAPRVLTAAVQDAISPALFDPAADNLDLYGGVGLLAAAVLDGFEGVRITTVESDSIATECAVSNLRDAPGATAITARVDRFLAERARAATRVDHSRLRAATVVLDPPRAGAGAGVSESLLRMQPAQIVYVACDPVAFARDAKTFVEGGYTLTGIRGFDLFPHTHHVEVVASLVRNDLLGFANVPKDGRG
ncbi:TRAM domain-containing protein [Lysinibacter sp. HNR]|uniref:class I SAM-dependent RNA methyltransferase n=1 Tax=Lysinibacter sp. HNR TaxID=3031408 RepID=UPI002434AF04|nr:TRAM domain-containing protein [Lysinibacter sp. HNR]WGD38046.1 TRAM domain-containing protein [Lysinibacter sp. HNR]